MSGRVVTVRERLAAGPARGLGEADAVAHQAVRSRALVEELMAALDDARPLVAARAANALKKIQAVDARALEPFARRLVQAGLRCEVLQARWSLTVVIGNLTLGAGDRALAIEVMFEALRSPSGFLRTFAMQALVNFSQQDPALRNRVRPIVDEALANGTAAMRTRARRLLAVMEGAGS